MFKSAKVILWIAHGALLTAAFVGHVPVTRPSTTATVRNIRWPIPSRPVVAFGASTTLNAKLWDRLEIEEDPEPFWYLLNCIAGLEIDLLRQCRDVCGEMPDALKFVVPSEKKTRSHGANRMVTEDKIRYQGYVFAKLRLCSETYEAIQELDLCRSWMGTVNHKGYKKLPPSPQALNELEIEKFGLEDLEFEEEEEEDGDIILDNKDDDYKPKSTVDEDALKVYLGLKVDDMIKVTKKGKFFGEDAILKRLKDGKIMARFFTYGSTFDEWMEPEDVRVLNSEEILKGLSGPTRPITQDDFDGPDEKSGGKEYNPRNQPGDIRGNLMSNVKGARGPRSRNVDREQRGDKFNRDLFGRTDDQKERDNWKWFQENERAKKGDGPQRGQAGDWKGEFEFQAGSPRKNNDAPLTDVDSQWGRPPSQRQKRKDTRARNTQENKLVENAIDGDADWSSFVSSDTTKKQPKEPAGEDAFFASLMDDLADDPGTQDAQKGGSGSRSKPKNDDDFFSSLMSELQTEEGSSNGKSDATSADDDFFAALEAEMGSALSDEGESKSVGSFSGDNGNDFFAKLEEEMMPSKSNEKSESAKSVPDPEPDFFATLDSALEAELNTSPHPAVTGKIVDPEPTKKVSSSSKRTAAPPKEATSSSPSSSLNSDDIAKFTVPVLKDMLRERGLKVSGKKAELIERLK